MSRPESPDSPTSAHQDADEPMEVQRGADALAPAAPDGEFLRSDAPLELDERAMPAPARAPIRHAVPDHAPAQPHADTRAEPRSAPAAARRRDMELEPRRPGPNDAPPDAAASQSAAVRDDAQAEKRTTGRAASRLERRMQMPEPGRLVAMSLVPVALATALSFGLAFMLSRSLQGILGEVGVHGFEPNMDRVFGAIGADLRLGLLWALLIAVTAYSARLVEGVTRQPVIAGIVAAGLGFVPQLLDLNLSDTLLSAPVGIPGGTAYANWLMMSAPTPLYWVSIPVGLAYIAGRMNLQPVYIVAAAVTAWAAYQLAHDPALGDARMTLWASYVNALPDELASSSTRVSYLRGAFENLTDKATPWFYARMGADWIAMMGVAWAARRG